MDTKFPLVKESTEKIKGVFYDNAYFPLKVFDGIKNHVFAVYGDEVKKVGGGSDGGYVASGKAAVSAGFILSQESLAWVTSFLQAKKEETKKASSASPPAAEPVPAQ